jgi:hypothetical protein
VNRHSNATLTKNARRPETSAKVTIQLAVTKEELSSRYEENRFALIKAFIGPEETKTLLTATYSTPARRVICGIPNVSWDEQNFDPEHPAHQFFWQREITDLIRSMTQLGTIDQLACWTSVYGLGEYINPHCDRGGSIQLLVCLQSPASHRNGGELTVGNQTFFLTAGDAVAFEATKLVHHTTPLVGSESDPNPRRVVLVGRYFLD